MNLRFRLTAHAWMIIPLCAIGFLVWIDWVRGRHVEFVTDATKVELKVEAASPTGYAGGVRRLIVPGQNNDSYHWIAQTQLMLARREWRVRQIDYENAPFGHEVSSPSPYRWWMGLVAWLDHEISGRPPGLSVERAALLADPLLHVLVLAGTTVFVAWRFGAWPAVLFSLGLVTIFPGAGGFLPGLPDDHGLARTCALWSVLLLLAGTGASIPVERIGGDGPLRASPRRSPWFLLAGFVGGLGLWMSPAIQAPMLAGIAVGALLAAWVTRGDATAYPLETAPWRAWALGGAATSLGAYLIEYFPSHLGSWQLRAIHPLYALAWLGGGELLLRMITWIRLGKRAWNLRALGLAVLAAVASAALPVVMWKMHNRGFLATDLLSSRLTKLPDGVVAANLWSWLLHDGITPMLGATILPVVLVLPAGWLMLRRPSGLASRMALALGPVAVALGFACWQLSWWSTFDVLLLVLLVMVTTAMGGTRDPRITRWIWSCCVAVVLAPGAYQLLPPAGAGAANALTELEAKELIERDLAHWLAKKVGAAGAVVLAPFSETSSLYFYGGLRGLATLDWENRDGLVSAVRIASATTTEEALELVHRRGVTHIIVPSWDAQLDEFAQAGLGQMENSLMDRLHHWVLPNWLRPVPYQLPTMTGLEGRTITILEVVEEQDDVVALSRIAEYFVAMGQLDRAAATGQTLRRFPADLGALAARAEVEIAQDDTAGFGRTLETLRSRVTAHADRGLPWDRRVALAVVLARGKHMEEAREQVRRCLAEVDEAGLRSLTTGSLYRLQVLSKAFGLEMADQRLRALALELTPLELRSRL